MSKILGLSHIAVRFVLVFAAGVLFSASVHAEDSLNQPVPSADKLAVAQAFLKLSNDKKMNRDHDLLMGIAANDAAKCGADVAAANPGNADLANSLCNQMTQEGFTQYLPQYDQYYTYVLANAFTLEELQMGLTNFNDHPKLPPSLQSKMKAFAENTNTRMNDWCDAVMQNVVLPQIAGYLAANHMAVPADMAQPAPAPGGGQ